MTGPARLTDARLAEIPDPAALESRAKQVESFSDRNYLQLELRAALNAYAQDIRALLAEREALVAALKDCVVTAIHDDCEDAVRHIRRTYRDLAGVPRIKLPDPPHG